MSDDLELERKLPLPRSQIHRHRATTLLSEAIAAIEADARSPWGAALRAALKARGIEYDPEGEGDGDGDWVVTAEPEPVVVGSLEEALDVFQQLRNPDALFYAQYDALLAENAALRKRVEQAERYEAQANARWQRGIVLALGVDALATVRDRMHDLFPNPTEEHTDE